MLYPAFEAILRAHSGKFHDDGDPIYESLHSQNQRRCCGPRSNPAVPCLDSDSPEARLKCGFYPHSLVGDYLACTSFLHAKDYTIMPSTLIRKVHLALRLCNAQSQHNIDVERV